MNYSIRYSAKTIIALIIILAVCLMNSPSEAAKPVPPPSPENDSQLTNGKPKGGDPKEEFPELQQLRQVNMCALIEAKTSAIIANSVKPLDRKSFPHIVDRLIKDGYIVTSYSNAWVEMKKRKINEDETAIAITDEGVTNFVDSASRKNTNYGEVCALKTVLKYIYDKISGEIIFQPLRYD